MGVESRSPARCPSINARALLAIALLVGSVLSGCAAPAGTPPTEPIPSEAEAAAFLKVLFRSAQAGDLDRLCSLSEPGCQASLRQVGTASVPLAPPRVAGSWVLEPVVKGNEVTIGGRVLRICGIDGLGRPYRTELLVETVGSSLRANDGVFWSSGRVAPIGAPVPLPSLDPSTFEGCP